MFRTYGNDLRQCGTKWGKEVDLSGSGIIAFHTGNSSCMETVINGVIGLHGNEPGKGPGIIIHDIEHAGIDMIWTSGLIGCMCIAITGTSKNARRDVFFTHARHYDRKDAITDPDNPLKLANDFIASHSEIRIFWGTDFNYKIRDFSGPTLRSEAQSLLSNILTYWVRERDCVVHQNLVFFPRLGIMKDGTPIEAYKWTLSQDMTSWAEFSNSMSLSRFIPDPVIQQKIQDHLTQLIDDRSSMIRFYFYDARRSNKISVMEHILAAYKVGNFDKLRFFAKHAANNTSPFVDPDAVNAWSASSEASLTATLVLEAYDDAKDKIRAMGLHGCGLQPDGMDIYSVKDYLDIKSENLAKPVQNISYHPAT